MPKIVDWDARRDEILSATWRVIARDGITGATIRAIAREANCSRGILAHYFDDKADILGSALVMSHRRVVARMNARADGLTGLAALRVVMLEALPLDGQGELAEGLDLNLAAHQLLVLIDGLSAERVLYPDRVTPARQEQMLDQLLEGLRREPRFVR